jgi:hypothetical protein
MEGRVSDVLGDGRVLDLRQLVHGRMGGGEAKARGKGSENTRDRPEDPTEGDRVVVLLGRQTIHLVEAVSGVHTSDPSLALAASLAPQGTSGSLG